MATSTVEAPRGRPRLWSLLALAVLLPAAFAIASWRDVKDLLWAGELSPVAVPAGAAAPYAGARFRLDAFKIVTGERGDPRLKMPPDRALALVRLEAVAERDVGELEWLACALTVLDDRGRRWKPLFLTLTRDVEKAIVPDAQETKGCSGAALAPKPAGTRLLVQEAFLVPRDALASLKPSFSVGSARPEALRFEGAAERR
ncbi:hypothetical protein [Chenggangzhangella methanolivorans]|uniref:Uncharacterized protein n=1 Tax=Chenggangzhangella methanolivorans TaxID=1437009 RepID=A0A9E6R721_9HYPH|nr:hypothetical protein [Chenggangzhangella methanolivorans]QZN99407.1 hypothetical protein K6K41_22070 [Chenggangzhangella methanolivorans]